MSETVFWVLEVEDIDRKPRFLAYTPSDDGWGSKHSLTTLDRAFRFTSAENAQSYWRRHKQGLGYKLLAIRKVGRKARFEVLT
jgi:hypothetical protein